MRSPESQTRLPVLGPHKVFIALDILVCGHSFKQLSSFGTLSRNDMGTAANMALQDWNPVSAAQPFGVAIPCRPCI